MPPVWVWWSLYPGTGLITSASCCTPHGAWRVVRPRHTAYCSMLHPRYTWCLWKLSQDKKICHTDVCATRILIYLVLRVRGLSIIFIMCSVLHNSHMRITWGMLCLLTCLDVVHLWYKISTCNYRLEEVPRCSAECLCKSSCPCLNVSLQAHSPPCVKQRLCIFHPAKACQKCWKQCRNSPPVS